VVNFYAFHIDEESARVSAITSIRKGRAMESWSKFYPAEGEIPSSPYVKGVSVYPLVLAIRSYFKVRDDGGVVAACDINGIPQVVSMAMAYQNILNLNRFRACRGQWISGNERVYNKSCPGPFYNKASMAIKSKLHAHFSTSAFFVLYNIKRPGRQRNKVLGRVHAVNAICFLKIFVIL